MKSYDLSLYCSGVRVNRWISIYKNIKYYNNLEIEIVICGNVPPNFELNDKIKFIYSETKPSQCAQIALNNTSSNLVALIGDDVVYSNNFFDNLMSYFKNNPNSIPGGVFKRNGIFYEHNDYLLDKDIKESPIFPMSPIMKKEEVFDIGGIDKSFIALMWHEDLIMRLISEKKRKPQLINSSICYEEIIKKNKIQKFFSLIFKDKFKKPGPGLFNEYGRNHDLPLLKLNWIGNLDQITKKINNKSPNKKKYLLKKRLNRVKKFRKNNILIKTQGNKGRWN